MITMRIYRNEKLYFSCSQMVESELMKGILSIAFFYSALIEPQVVHFSCFTVFGLPSRNNNNQYVLLRSSSRENCSQNLRSFSICLILLAVGLPYSARSTSLRLEMTFRPRTTWPIT